MSITDNVSSVTISRTTAEKLQRNQPVVRKDALKHRGDKPTEGEVQSMAVNEEIWEIQRAKAETIAEEAIRSEAIDPTADLSPEAKAKVRSLASRLIVINNDSEVVVYNNTKQADEARRTLRANAQAELTSGTAST